MPSRVGNTFIVPAAGIRKPATVCLRENSAKHRKTMATATTAVREVLKNAEWVLICDAGA